MLEPTLPRLLCRSLLIRLLVVISFVMNGTTWLSAQDLPSKDVAGQRWAVILVGLPGDDPHADLFAETADAWQKWLTDSLQFPAEQVLRFPAVSSDDKAPKQLTAETMRAALALLTQKLQPNDTLWVFTLGHGHYDGQRAWFHAQGRDPSNEDFGRWLSEVRCREQVVWLTHASSGWFVKPLSRPGRIVIAATAADDESNETEFPHALASLTKLPVEKLDIDKDQQVSIAELFTAVLSEVNQRFQADKRLPTEHAQLDDNGDGKGTEELAPAKADEAAAATPNTPTAKTDGELARKVLVPFRPIPADAKPSPAAPNGF